MSVEGEKPLFYGSRCEKYDVIKRTKGSAIPDLFEEREQMLLAPYEGEEKLRPMLRRSGYPGFSFSRNVSVLEGLLYGIGLTGFKGFDLSQRHYEQTSFECKGCPNLCLIRKVSVEGGKAPLLRKPM